MKKYFFEEKLLGQSKSFLGVGDKYSAGQITIVGGSSLFHGAPILALKAASRLVSMTYFSGPTEDRGVVEKIKSGLTSFVWVERDEVANYIAKSDAVLIGPGLMRSHVKEQKFVCDFQGEETRKLSRDLFAQFPDKPWVVDGGTLQVVTVGDIPKGAVVTPNKKEFEMLFGEEQIDDWEKRCEQVQKLSRETGLIILTKGAVSVASDGQEVWVIEGGNDGLVKGGVGDVMAGLALGFLAKNDPLYSVCAATFLVKKTAEKLAENRGLMYNSEDVAEMVPTVYGDIMKRL